MTAVRIEPGDPASAAATALLGELDSYLNGLYPPEDNFLELPMHDVDGDSGVFLIAWRGATAVGCGAVRRRTGGRMEIKRMYVRPDARGAHTGTALLDALEAWARDRGATELVLETGADQPEALGLYARAGFVAIPCFDEYANAPNSLCLGKSI